MVFTTCASAAKEDVKALAKWAKERVKKMVGAKKKIATERAAEPEPPPLTPKKQEALEELRAKKKSRELALRPRKAPDKLEPAMMWSTAKHKLVAFAPGKEQSTGNRIIDLDAVHILLHKTDCNVCHRKGCLMIDAKLEADTRRGLASDLPLWCKHCKIVVDHLPTSKQLPAKSKHGAGLMEINVRAVTAATQMGIGESGLGRLAACLNMPKMGKDCYRVADDQQQRASIAVGKRSMAAAMAEERQLAFEEDEELLDDQGCVGIQLEMDGQWQKPGKGYNSKEGATTAVGGRTRKIVAGAHRSKDCSHCKRLQMPCGRVDCNKNHVGSSASMESEGAVEIVSTLDVCWAWCAELCTDCDSSLQAQVKAAVEAAGSHPAPETRYSPNHVIKAGKGKLLPSAKKAVATRGALTQRAGLRLMKETAYALHQHRGCGDARKLAAALNNVLAHAFNDHSRCTQFFNCPCANGTRTKSYFNDAGDWLDKLGGNELRTILEKEWHARMTSDERIERLLSMLSTQRVEAFHSLRASIQPKRLHLCATIKGQGRYFAAVKRYNDGAEAAVVDTLMEMGVEDAGVHLHRGLARFDKERARKTERMQIPSAKRMRREAKQRGRERDAERPARSNAMPGTYSPGMAFDRADEPRRGRGRAPNDPDATVLLQARAKLATAGGNAARATSGRGKLTAVELKALLADAGSQVGGDRAALVARFLAMRAGAGGSSGGSGSGPTAEETRADSDWEESDHEESDEESNELDWAELEVITAELAASHPEYAQLVGADVCVMAAAFPEFELQRRNAIGWRGQVSAIRGRAGVRAQVEVFGVWWRLADAAHIRPIIQESCSGVEKQQLDGSAKPRRM